MTVTRTSPAGTSSRSAGACRPLRPRPWRAILVVVPALALMTGPLALLPVFSTSATAAEGNPLIVGGYQVGDRMQAILDEIAVALDGVNDAETAKTAVETFSEAERQILELEPFMLLLPHEGKTAIAAQVTGALIIMKPTADRLLADKSIAPVLKPGFERLVDKFKSLGS